VPHAVEQLVLRLAFIAWSIYGVYSSLKRKKEGKESEDSKEGINVTLIGKVFLPVQIRPQESDFLMNKFNDCFPKEQEISIQKFVTFEHLK